VRRRALIIAVLAGLAAACARHAPPPAPVAPAAAPAAPASALPLVGRFTGALPCADCGAVQADLILSGDWSGRTQFQLAQTYADGPNAQRTVRTSGTWTRRRGTASDSGAVVYSLIPEPAAAALDFVVIDERQIRLLGPQLQPLPDSDAATLTRVDGR